MTPALVAGIAYLLDRQFGTGPWLTIVLTTFTVGYLVWKLWYNYNVEMTKLEAELIKKRTGEISEDDAPLPGATPEERR